MTPKLAKTGFEHESYDCSKLKISNSKNNESCANRSILSQVWKVIQIELENINRKKL